MSGPTDRALTVIETPQGEPHLFLWRGHRVKVREIIDDWEEEGCWWRDEEPRRVYRVLGHDGTLYELHRLTLSGWQMFREGIGTP